MQSERDQDADEDLAGVGSHLLVVERITLIDSHRGEGSGRFVLRDIIRTVGYGCAAVLIKPFPLRKHDDPQMTAAEIEVGVTKLRAYWSACEGFKALGGDHLLLDLGERNDWLEGR